jgi:glutamyl-tRNA reductase
MSIVLVGLNHKTAPLDVRERLAFTDAACAAGLRDLVDGEVVREGLIVSTCNRVEVLAALSPAKEVDAESHVCQFLSSARSIPSIDFSKHIYAHSDDEAIRHVFRVASALDAMVVGEAQILGQFRRAYSLAVEAGTAGRILNRLVHHAFHVAKRVRSETGIASNAVSISYMAVELGRKIFGSLKDSTVLLLGAGEMAELAARHLINAGAGKMYVANRTPETAGKLAKEFQGEAIRMDQVPVHLSQADIVICSTGAEDYVITKKMARKALDARGNRPTFFIDISVPRNIDPAIADIGNLFVFNIDDLEAVIASNIREREREAERAELIVESELMQFQQTLRTLDIGPEIGALRGKMQDIARSELVRQRHRLGQLTPDQERAVESLLISTVNKISHPVMLRMRRSYAMHDDDDSSLWRDLFEDENPTKE